jgi:acetate kinase
MKILVINPGSTTIKFKLFDDLEVIAEGGLYNENENYYYKYKSKSIEQEEKSITKEDFHNAPNIIENLIKVNIDKIGFRIVHGGENYIEPTILTEEVVIDLEKLNILAPLHNPPALNLIKKYKGHLPKTEMWGVFDTAFHSTLPKKAYLYALPYKFYEKYKIRKYGFHGTSVEYVIDKLDELEPKASKVIVCHLGGGASITAVKNGKSIDTSMGFTPLDGLIMASRSGEVDNGVIYYLLDNTDYNYQDLNRIENEQSGLKGLSEKTSDMKELLDLEKEGDNHAQLAIDKYIYQIQKYIGSYSASLGGVDTIIFTGGIGSGSFELRQRIMNKFGFLNFKIDENINQGAYNVKDPLKISNSSSNNIWVIPTNEELQIAKKIIKLS